MKKRIKVGKLHSCPAKPALSKRPLLGSDDAQRLEGIFKVLSNATRLRLLHALVRRPGMCVTDLSNSVKMKPQAVSNQLQRLINGRILASKRNGNQIHYWVIDPCVITLLDQGLCLSEDAEERGQ